MNGQPIAELNAGLNDYKDSLVAEPLAAKRVEVAIITFGGEVKTVCDWTTVDNFQPPVLASTGDTPMGAAIRHGIEMVRHRTETYRANGIDKTRPWIFLITDGAPTDEWQSAAVEVQAGETGKHFVFYPVGVEGANFDVLAQFRTEMQPLKLRGLAFRTLFRWLSDSQKAASRSKPGQDVPLANPTAAGGWAVMPG
jgi:uncharacterized protein YegL